MAFILADRVKETTITTGTSNLALGGAFGGFRTFSSAIGNGNSTYYGIETSDGNYEVGVGTYTSASNTLSRDTVISSSNSGSKISLTGVSTVFVTQPGTKALFVNPDSYASGVGFTGYAFPDGTVQATSATDGAAPAKLTRSNAGVFFQYFVDNGNDRTVALHMENEELTPQWKMGLKDSPSSQTEAPSYGYVFGENGSAGAYADANNAIYINSNNGFWVIHESASVFNVDKSDGSIFKNGTASTPTLTVRGASAQSAKLQQWETSAESVVASVDNAGKFICQTLEFGDGTTQSTAGYTGTGHLYVDQYIYHNGDTNTYIRFRGDQLDFVAGGRTMLTLDEASNDKVIVNDGGHDVDFQVEGQSDANLIRTDAANDRVGIGTSSPSYLLDIDGTARMTTLIFADGTSQTTAGSYSHWRLSDDSSGPFNISDNEELKIAGGANVTTSYDGTYKTLTITATDTNTTYTAGNGLVLAGTEFSAPDVATASGALRQDITSNTAAVSASGYKISGVLQPQITDKVSSSVFYNSGQKYLDERSLLTPLSSFYASGQQHIEKRADISGNLQAQINGISAGAEVYNVASGVVVDNNLYAISGNGGLLDNWNYASGISVSGAISASGYAISGALQAQLANRSNWDTAYGWGNHASAGYLTSETWNYASGVSVSGAISASGYAISGALQAQLANKSNWDTAYGWGNHASASYLTSETWNYASGVSVSGTFASYAPLASPTFTGTPAAPTASAATNTTQIATTAFVRTEISNLVDSAPGALDTLNELAAAINDDASFSTTITNSIATKIGNVVEDTTPQLGGTLDANSNSIDMGTNTITDTKVGQWDTAYGWGNHASAGYLTSETWNYASGVSVSGAISTSGYYISGILQNQINNFSAGNGLALSSSTFSIADPATLTELTESTDATDDKILLWDEDASTWKYMTLDNLQDSIDTTGGGGGGSGDIEGVTAGDGLSGGGTSGSVSLALDLNELTAASVADGDFIAIIDTNDSNASRKEAVHDLATLFAGAGLTATNSVIAVDTLNQNTTGSAATLTTARNINGVAFDGSANITVTAAGTTLSDTVPVSKGGTGATALADKAVLITQDSGTDTVSAAVMDANGELLIGGTDGPAVATLTQGSNVTITNGNGTIEIASTQLTTEQVQDIVGAMVGSNTESGITVAYQDADGTLDFTVGTLNQDTSGTAAIATTVTVADESSDTTCFPLFVTTATGDQAPKSGSNLTFNSDTGLLTATSLGGTLTTAAQANVTSLGTLTTLTVDNVIINGTTIGHTDDTDLITLADGVVTVAGEISVTTLDIGGTNVTSTAAELNILDGVTSTAAELNILDGVTSTAAELNILDGVTTTAAEINLIDGGTARESVTIVDADGILVNDGGTMKMVLASSLKTYAGGGAGDITEVVAGVGLSGGATSGSATLTVDLSEFSDVTPTNGDKLATLDSDGSTEQLTTIASLATLFAGTGLTATNSVIEVDAAQTQITSVGALDAGSITSNFGTINTGASAITTTGLISGGSLDIDNVLINGTTIGHTDDTDLITLADGIVTVAGEISVTTLDIGGTNVTSTAAELNILDGVTSTAAELNILDGVTSTAAELNILDGVTSTAAELNILDGVTATATELNYLDITTLGTAENSKAFTRKGDGTATFAGTTIADLGEVTTADINGGTIDGADVTVGSSKTLDVSGGTLTTSAAQKQAIVSGADGAAIDNCVIGGSTAAAGTFTSITIGSAAINETELEMLDGITAGTAAASKAVVLDGSKNIATIGTIGCGAITSTGSSSFGATSFGDNDITNVGNIALDSITADGSTITITGNTTFADGSYDFDIASHDATNGLKLGGTLVTATAAELNILDGVTSTAAELNILDGVTSTAAELNILDGVTASAADINLIDGITNGTVIASKAIITDSNKDITGGRNITISGELDADSIDIEGDADINGTLEADAITVGGTNIVTGSLITTLGTISAGVWQGTAIASAYIADNAITGAKIALGSDAAGDIMYYNGTDYVRLGIGSDGQVLTVNDAANAPQWEAAGGGAVSAVANGADNRVTTFSSSTALNGEANLTFDGSTLGLTGCYVQEAVPANDTPTVEDATIILDLNAGNYHNISLNADVTQIQFTNANRGQRFILRITQHASSAKTVAWTDVDYNGSSGTATVRWAGGTVPVMSTETSHTDVYGFLCTNDAGSAFDGFIIGQDLPD